MEDETELLSEDDQGSSDQDKAPTTKPMLEAILAEVRAGFAEVNQRLAALETAMRDGFDNTDRRLGVLSDDINKLRADAVKYNKRLDELERKAS